MLASTPCALPRRRRIGTVCTGKDTPLAGNVAVQRRAPDIFVLEHLGKRVVRC